MQGKRGQGVDTELVGAHVVAVLFCAVLWKL
jgi:hypothetical protein